MIDVFKFKGKEKGISLLILAGIHGNEIAGIEALNRLIEELNNGKIKLLAGSLTLVPVCNPLAYQKDVRQIDENLNRVIKMHKNPATYEQQLANEICPLIASHDLMLDLHSTHTKGDEPFAFCDYPDKYNQKLISALNVKYILTGWPTIYQENKDISDCSTEEYAHRVQKRGTTLECGYHKDKKSIELAYQSVINALSIFGFIKEKNILDQAKEEVQLTSYVVKEKEGALTQNYKHLDKIKKGETIARYQDGETKIAPFDGYILLPNPSAEIGAEWYYLGQKISL